MIGDERKKELLSYEKTYQVPGKINQSWIESIAPAQDDILRDVNN